MENQTFKIEIINEGKTVKLTYENGNWSTRSISGYYNSVAETIKSLIKEIEDKEIYNAWQKSILDLPLEEQIKHPDFCYSRSREYGVTLYFRTKYSPTGVIGIGGCSHEEARILFNGNKSPLSPTENLQSAR
jgi:hypothetical protein